MNNNTERNYNFIATDIHTGEITQFTLWDVILSDTIRDSLHEEMDIILLNVTE